MANTAKTVIINDTNSAPFLINRLHPDFKSGKNQFNYIKLELTDKKFINVYECSEIIADIFLSKRCLIIITFETSSDMTTLVASIMRRLLKVAATNVVPNSVMILGLKPLPMNIFTDIVKTVKKQISKLQVVLLYIFYVN